MTVIEAIRAGDLEAMQAAIAADHSAVDERCPDGVSAVLTALYYRRTEFVEALIAAGATVDFFLACALGQLIYVSRFLDMNPELLSQHTPDGWTGLHLAAFFGHPEMAKFLLDRGADPLLRSTNKMQNLPLHAAAAARQADLVELLLEAGSPVDATQHGGYTALHSAAQNKDMVTFELLLKFGGDPNTPSDDGKTPASLLPPA
jgi:ankyrin repeat protein